MDEKIGVDLLDRLTDTLILVDNARDYIKEVADNWYTLPDQLHVAVILLHNACVDFVGEFRKERTRMITEEKTGGNENGLSEK